MQTNQMIRPILKRHMYIPKNVWNNLRVIINIYPILKIIPDHKTSLPCSILSDWA